MNDLAARQDSPRALDLLAAQRCLYSDAKWVRSVRVGATAFLAALAPVLAVTHPAAAPLLAVVGAAFGMLGRLVGLPWEEALTRQAALIQEQFDGFVLGIEPRDDIQLVPEDVARAARRCSSRTTLRRWYATSDELPHGLGCLAAQASGVAWTLRQRRHYAVLVALAVALLATIDVVVGRSMTVTTWMLALVVPSLPAFTHGIEVVRKQWRARAHELSTMGKIEQAWRAGLSGDGAVDVATLRSIQDRILHQRSEHPPVPDWLHRAVRRGFEKDAESALATRVRDFRDARRGCAGTAPMPAIPDADR